MNLIIPAPNSSIAFYIFNYPIKYYGLCLGLAIFVGLVLVYYFLKKRFSEPLASNFIDISPFLIIVSLIGARLFYILGDLKYYLNNPKEMLFINHGGLSIYGAIFFAIVFLFIYCKKNKILFLKFSDCLALIMPLCQSIGRWGNYFNQEAFGLPSSGFVKLSVDYIYRPIIYRSYDYFHPAFLYESLLNLLLFIFLFGLFVKCKNLKYGTIFSLYLVSYGIIRLTIENIRVDSVLNLYGFHVASIISFLILAMGIIFFININLQK